MIRALIVLFAIAPAFAQSTREFEVASIRPSSDQGTQVNAGLTINGAQARFLQFSLKDYLGIAYALKSHQIVGPDWLTSEKFDIVAKIPDGVSQVHVPEMLQALLADRFKLKAHREKKEFPVYALVVAKGGLKMKESAADPGAENSGALSIAASGSSAGAGVNLGNGSSFGFAENRIEGRKLTMDALADMLSRFVDRPVIDMTGVKGNYDLRLDLSPEDSRAMMVRSAVMAGIVLPPQALRLLESASNASLSDALEKAGLALESRRSPLDVVVVENMEKVPTEN